MGTRGLVLAEGADATYTTYMTYRTYRTHRTDKNREGTIDRTIKKTDGTHWTMCSSSTGVLEGHSTHFLAGRPDLHPSLDLPAEGLQMAHSFDHIPVLRDEVVSLYASVPPGVLVDATVGGGGHSAAVLEAYPALRVVGMDRDPAALEAATERLHSFGDRVTLIRSPFSALDDVLSGLELGGLSGVLLDLGVSSPQLDQADRGFSFRVDGPLDMRMDPTTGATAAELVNSLPEDVLATLFRENGEGRLSGRIARAVVRARPVTSTGQLADVVASAVPAAVRRRGHPARRVFQALRIEVNDELGQLAETLPAALSSLAVGGVCAVISYHSGEDRLTKQLFAEAASGGCVCPPHLPCVCGAVARHQLVFRGARKPSAAEVAANPRAESARLRAIVRTGAD
ncbi:MAG TPA: 16S rRNA (cytosine(1402)-N(4))-methyltransferase RsmH [Myxococcaceae bacterium]|jgi:16S rRNA (cytosine1402-N4)-methyltransferase